MLDALSGLLWGALQCGCHGLRNSLSVLSTATCHFTIWREMVEKHPHGFTLNKTACRQCNHGRWVLCWLRAVCRPFQKEPSLSMTDARLHLDSSCRSCRCNVHRGFGFGFDAVDWVEAWIRYWSWSLSKIRSMRRCVPWTASKTMTLTAPELQQELDPAPARPGRRPCTIGTSRYSMVQKQVMVAELSKHSCQRTCCKKWGQLAEKKAKAKSIVGSLVHVWLFLFFFYHFCIFNFNSLTVNMFP